MPLSSGVTGGGHSGSDQASIGFFVKPGLFNISFKRVRAFLVALSCLFLAGGLKAAALPLDRPAVKSPKAAHSLLLDITRADSGQRLVSVGDRGHIVFSDDNGKTWRQASVPTMQMLTAVDFPSETVGYAVGHDAIVLKSRDGGETWSQVFVDREAALPLLDVWFANERHGYAVGAYGYIIETLDGGSSWKPVDSRIANDEEFHYNAIHNDGGGYLYLAGEAGILFRSMDQGKTWSTLSSPYEGSWFGINRSRDGGILVHGLRGNIYKSSDRGETWKSLVSGTDQTLFGSAQLSDGRTVLVGNSGSMLTGDSSRWTLSHRSDRNALSALAPSSDGNLVVVGQGGAFRMTPDGRALE